MRNKEASFTFRGQTVYINERGYHDDHCTLLGEHVCRNFAKYFVYLPSETAIPKGTPWLTWVCEKHIKEKSMDSFTVDQITECFILGKDAGTSQSPAEYEVVITAPQTPVWKAQWRGFQGTGSTEKAARENLLARVKGQVYKF